MDDVVREIGLGATLPLSRGLMGSGVTVAVLDSGIDARHPFLEVSASVSTCAEPAGVPGRHGTHCAGVIASRSPHRPGIAPEVRLLDVKIARTDGSTRPDWLVAGIEAALELGADVLSISFGLNSLPVSVSGGHGWACAEPGCILCQAVDQAVARGAVVVAAAGNEHPRVLACEAAGHPLPAGGGLLCPGRARGALAVGALRKEPLRRLDPRSSRGIGKPDLVAPGLDVTSTVPLPRNGPQPNPLALFGVAGGSSVATAVVAGAVALLVERRRATERSTSPAAVRRELLSRHVRPLDPRIFPPAAVGAGRLDLSSFQRCLQEPGTSLPSFQET